MYGVQLFQEFLIYFIFDTLFFLKWPLLRLFFNVSCRNFRLSGGCLCFLVLRFFTEGYGILLLLLNTVLLTCTTLENRRYYNNHQRLALMLMKMNIMSLLFMSKCVISWVLLRFSSCLFQDLKAHGDDLLVHQCAVLIQSVSQPITRCNNEVFNLSLEDCRVQWPMSIDLSWHFYMFTHHSWLS